MHRPLGTDAAKPIQFVLIQHDAEAWSCGNRETELAVVERFAQNLLRQQQRTEKFGSPLELRERRKQVRRRNVSCPIEADTRRIRDRGDPSASKQTAGL